MVELFTSAYVTFISKPTIINGILELSGHLDPEFVFEQVQVWYDEPPHVLTLGQLDATECVTVGEAPVAFIRRPPPLGSYYVDGIDTYTWDRCRSPYSVDSQQPRNEPPDFGLIRITAPLPMGSINAPWLTARKWRVQDNEFYVQADLREVVAEHGPGVYTIIVWGGTQGEVFPLTDYPIFLPK